MKKLLFLDCEWVNNYNQSLCQIGLLLRDAETLAPLKEDLNLLINPEDSFDKDNVALHGITKKMVKDAPNFPAVWNQVASYFDDAIVVGHAVENDFEALSRNFARYGLNVPTFSFIDTHALALAAFPTHKLGGRHNLQMVCRYLRMPHFKAHDAFQDAKACLFIYQKAMERFDLHYEALVQTYQKRSKRIRMQKRTRSALLELRQYAAKRRGSQSLTTRQTRAIDKWLGRNVHLLEETETIYALAQRVVHEGGKESPSLLALRKALQESTDSSSDKLLASLKKLASLMRQQGRFDAKTKTQIVLWMYYGLHQGGGLFFNAVCRLLHLCLEEERFSSEAKLALDKIIEHRDDPPFLMLATCNVRLSTDRLQKKHITLHGTFRFGDFAAVRRFLEAHGAILDPKPIPGTTQYLLRGEAGINRYLGGLGGEHALLVREAGIQLVAESSLLPPPWKNAPRNR